MQHDVALLLKTGSKPLTLLEVEAACRKLRDEGGTDKTPVYGSAGQPGNEVLLQPLTAATPWQVGGQAGGNFCIRGGKVGLDTNAEKIGLILTIGANPTACWSIRYQDKPDTVYLLPANGAADFLESQGGRRLLVPPVPITSYMDMTLYIGRDEQDTDTPEIRFIIVPEMPFDDSQTGNRYTLFNKARLLMEVYQNIRRNHGVSLFGEGTE